MGDGGGIAFSKSFAQLPVIPEEFSQNFHNILSVCIHFPAPPCANTALSKKKNTRCCSATFATIDVADWIRQVEGCGCL